MALKTSREIDEEWRIFTARTKESADWIRKYYELVDQGNLEEMYKLFVDDIIYNRCEQTIEGIDALKHFYEKERKIQGHHEINHFFSRLDDVAVLGTFHKQAKEGVEPVEFWDYFSIEKFFLLPQGIRQRNTMLLYGTLGEFKENSGKDPRLSAFKLAVENAVTHSSEWNLIAYDGHKRMSKANDYTSGSHYVAGIFGTGDNNTLVYLPIGMEKIK